MDESHDTAGLAAGASGGRDAGEFARAVGASPGLDDGLKRALVEARGAIDRLALSEADRDDAVEGLGKLVRELERPARDEARVRRLFDYLRDLAPPAAAALSTALTVARDDDWRERLLASLEECTAQPARGSRVLRYIVTVVILLAIVGLSRLGTMVLQESLRHVDPPIVSLAWALWFAFGVFVVSRVYNRVLRRHWQRMARTAEQELRRSGSRRPIFYLRSFGLDERIGRPSWFERFLGTIPLATAEQKLAAELRKVGPVIAIGRPGERLPALGAARFYVTDDLWQKKVADVVSSSQRIVWATGVTEGLRWEIGHLVETTDPEKLILWAHPHLLRVGPREREAEWRRFVALLGDAFPKPLPEVLGEARFIYFTPDWRPRPVAPPGQTLRWAIRSLLSPLRSALRAVLQVKRGALSGLDVAYEPPSEADAVGRDFAHLIGADGRPFRWPRALGFVAAMVASLLPVKLMDPSYPWLRWLIWPLLTAVPALAAFRLLRGIAGPAALAAAATALLRYGYAAAVWGERFGRLDTASLLVPFVRTFLFLAGLAWATRTLRPLGQALAVGAIGSGLAGWAVQVLSSLITEGRIFVPWRSLFLDLANMACFAVAFLIAVRLTPPRPEGKDKTPLLPDL